MRIDGFDWDHGNWPKCAKHGLSKAEIEQVMLSEPAVMQDPCPTETSMRAIGRTLTNRYVFLVFTVRIVEQRNLLRPISARYMHQREIESYEQQTKKDALAKK